MAGDRELLKLERISKAFPGVLANDHISFELRQGEIHALVGENGAGKTTLVSILYGLERPDAGTILVDGKQMVAGDPHQAIVHGLGFVQQHYSLIPTLTVIENLILSSHYGAGRPLSRREIEDRVRDISRRYGLAVDLRAKIERLSVGEQQRVELMKMLIASPRILILDEPSALLSATEVEQLWDILRELANEGVGIILIAHKLEEVLALADRITVLRQGRVVATVAASDVDATKLGAMMVGKLAADELKPRASAVAGRHATALEVRALWVSGDRSRHLVKGVSLAIGSGEILGVAGIIGNGQVELLEALMGIREIERGEILLHGRDISHLSIRDRQAQGMAFVPGDRHRDGLIGPMSLADNLALSFNCNPPVSRTGILQPAAVEQRARALISRFGISAAGPGVRAATLSGGNQQKLILAREFARDPEVIVSCYPTRGLDFAATAAVHEELRRAAGRGAGVLVVSIDLNELLALSHRLIVMQAGRVIGETAPGKVTEAELGLMLGGGIAA
jgi:general nucleoside transport system ATP-binding protein